MNEYKVGDLVFLICGHSTRLAKVQKVTSIGGVQVSGMMFVNGCHRRSIRCSYFIKPTTPESLLEFKKKEWKLMFAKELVGKNLMVHDYETLKEVSRLLKMNSFKEAEKLEENA